MSVQEEIGYVPPLEKKFIPSQTHKYKQVVLTRMKPEIDAALDQLLRVFEGSYDARGRLSLFNEAKCKILEIWPLSDTYYDLEQRKYGLGITELVKSKI